MKNTINYLLLFLSLSLFLIQCSSKNPSTVRFAIFIDTTDSLNQKWEIENYVDKFLQKAGVHSETGAENGIELAFYAINELSDTKSYPVDKLALGDPMGSNRLVRRNQINNFRKNVVEKYKEFKVQQGFGKPNTRIYQNLCNYFNAVPKQSPNDKTIVIIFSDMIEHSEHLSFYGDANQQKIRSAIYNDAEKKKLISALELKTGCSMTNLANYEIYVVFDRNRTNNIIIDLSSVFWREFFKLKNNNIFYSSNLNFN